MPIRRPSDCITSTAATGPATSSSTSLAPSPPPSTGSVQVRAADLRVGDKVITSEGDAGTFSRTVVAIGASYDHLDETPASPNSATVQNVVVGHEAGVMIVPPDTLVTVQR